MHNFQWNLILIEYFLLYINNNIKNTKPKKIKSKPASKILQWVPRRLEGCRRSRWRKLIKIKTNWSLYRNINLVWQTASWGCGVFTNRKGFLLWPCAYRSYDRPLHGCVATDKWPNWSFARHSLKSENQLIESESQWLHLPTWGRERATKVFKANNIWDKN